MAKGTKPLLPTTVVQRPPLSPSNRRTIPTPRPTGYRSSSSRDGYRSSPSSRGVRITQSPVLDLLHNRSKTRRSIIKMMKLGPLFQLALLFIIFILVLQSHMRSSFAQEKLLQFREEESQLMLQLQKIERHSLRLHENIRRRLQKAGIPEDDEDPLLTQTSQLYQMSEELNEQVVSLEESIKHQSRDNIIRELGEGPVKVVLELEFLDKDESSSNNFQRRRTESNTQISILLWPETPHAAWTWLEQIERHIWDGAAFHWSTSQPVLEVAPSKSDPLQRGRLEFTEHVSDHSNWHGAWTVGMRETNGKLQMFFNLKDNAEYQKHESCVGKVLDGFDALQRLLEAPRRQNGDVSSIRIKKANAMHVTKRELGIM